MTNDRTSDTRAAAPKRELTEEQLNTVSGGSVTSPRDAASGMATGKRLHKPFVLRMF